MLQEITASRGPNCSWLNQVCPCGPYVYNAIKCLQGDLKGANSEQEVTGIQDRQSIWRIR